jgi:hypothetical protein
MGATSLTLFTATEISLGQVLSAEASPSWAEKVVDLNKGKRGSDASGELRRERRAALDAATHFVRWHRDGKVRVSVASQII